MLLNGWATSSVKCIPPIYLGLHLAQTIASKLAYYPCCICVTLLVDILLNGFVSLLYVCFLNSFCFSFIALVCLNFIFFGVFLNWFGSHFAYLHTSTIHRGYLILCENREIVWHIVAFISPYQRSMILPSFLFIVRNTDEADSFLIDFLNVTNRILH